jgi:HPt (histidine-containing phosphotransfer) domain-containing protein
MKVPAELKRNYLERRIRDLGALRQALETGDYGLAAKLGHQVKGNAATFEFPQIAPLGLAMEKAAKKQDRGEITQLIGVMESLLLSAQQDFAV